MYAFVSNEYQGIIYSRTVAQVLADIYSYPVIQYVKTAEEGYDFIRKKNRKFYINDTKQAGWKETTAYLRIEYFVGDDTVYANIYTDHFGYVYLNIRDSSDIKQSVTYDMIKVKLTGRRMRDQSITSHCQAIQNVLHLFSPIINVQIVVPDISVYLALTRYTGKSSAIRMARRELDTRIGKVMLVVR